MHNLKTLLIIQSVILSDSVIFTHVTQFSEIKFSKLLMAK
jgi:hypothetical protein